MAGHDPAVCLALFEAVDDLNALGPEPLVPVVTGDLTALGSDRQLAEARAMLSAEWALGGVDGLGLPFEESDWRPHTVAGNHDHWSGLPFPVQVPSPLATKGGMRRTFFHTPRAQPDAFSLGYGWSVRFLRIDTDAEVGFRDRIDARGGCSGQVEELIDELGAIGDDPREVRVLLLHVPFSLGLSAPREQLVLDDSTRQALEALGRSRRVRVFLTGHLHTPTVSALPGSFAAGAFQARAGSCTQSLLPAEPGASHPPVNTFMVHDLRAGPSSLVWKTTVYWYARGTFVPVAGTPGLGHLVFSSVTFRP